MARIDSSRPCCYEVQMTDSYYEPMLPVTTMETDIKNLKDILNLPPNVVIVSCGASHLTNAADGYSSTIHQLNVHWKVYNGDADSVSSAACASTSSAIGPASASDSSAADAVADQSGEINLIVKRMPDCSQWISLMISKLGFRSTLKVQTENYLIESEATFEKEFNMYTLLAPSYETILNQLFERRPDNPDDTFHQIYDHLLIPKFFGGRLNLENRLNHVDENAILLLENLMESGFETCRISNLDASHFTAVLERLAIFHAVGIIIRHDPKYKTTFENLLETSQPFFFGAKDRNIEQVNARKRMKTMEIVETFNYSETINAKLMDILEKTDKKTLPSSQTCYSTLLHNDLWLSNVMFQYADDSKEVKDIDTDKVNDAMFQYADR
ncbi:hypothetical protein WDU94_011814 [Cyamophila willieti]